MNLFGLVVEVEALELWDLVLAGVEEDHEIVVHLWEIVEEGGDEEPIKILFSGVVEKERLDGAFECVVIAHSSNYCAIILQNIELIG